MDPRQQELREQMCEAGRLLHQKDWVAANDGNISVRLDEHRILCTPTNISKGRMKPEDLIVVDFEGQRVEGSREPTSEITLHLTVYSMRPDIHSVVHAHPPIATGFAVAGRALDQAVLPEVIVGLGIVPLARYGLPGTPALTEPMLPLIPKYDAILMGNHGAVTYGADLWSAYYRMERVEHSAHIILVAEQLGGPQVLPRREVEQLFRARDRYGVRGRNVMEPGCPLVREDLPQEERRFEFSRAELQALLDEALRARDEELI